MNDVGAGADAAVEQHGEVVADRVGDRRQRVERGDLAVDLAAAVVGDDDAVDPALARRRGVLGMKDPLEQDRQVGRRAQELEVVPAQLGVGELHDELADGRLQVLLGRLVEQRQEDRVGGVVGDPDALEERLPGALEVARLPARQERVDGEHDRAVAGAPRRARSGSLRARGCAASRAGTTSAPPAAAPATSSSENDEAVLSVIVSPTAAAARATASSPSSWTIDWTPIGASITGAGIGVPSTSTERSRWETSRSIRGTIRQRRNASRLARIVSSRPAPPNTYEVARRIVELLLDHALELGDRDRVLGQVAGRFP